MNVDNSRPLPTINLGDGPTVCPECSHDNVDARRSWWDKLRGRTRTQCRHYTIEQDAVADSWDVCECTDDWHQ
jgi:hypothetical protein